MSEKDDKVEQALDRFPDLSYDDKQQIIESMEGEQKTNITRILEKSEGIQRGILMGLSGVLSGIAAGVYIEAVARGNWTGAGIGFLVILVVVLIILGFSWFQARQKRKLPVLFKDSSLNLVSDKNTSINDKKSYEDTQSPQTVTLNNVAGVFDEVQGPAITSTDVTEHLNCTRKSAQQKLQRLDNRGDIAHRKAGRRVLWWRTDGESDSDTEQGNATTGDT